MRGALTDSSFARIVGTHRDDGYAQRDAAARSSKPETPRRQRDAGGAEVKRLEGRPSGLRSAVRRDPMVRAVPGVIVPPEIELEAT